MRDVLNRNASRPIGAVLPMVKKEPYHAVGAIS
jgi:hypothetical protein